MVLQSTLKIPFLLFCKRFCLLEKYTLHSAFSSPFFHSFFLSFPFPFSFQTQISIFPWGWTHISSKRHFFLIRWLERFIKCVVYGYLFSTCVFWLPKRMAEPQAKHLAAPVRWFSMTDTSSRSPLIGSQSLLSFLPFASRRIDFVKWHCVTFADYFRNEAKLIRVIRFHGSLLKKQTYKQAECEGIAELMMN